MKVGDGSKETSRDFDAKVEEVNGIEMNDIDNTKLTNENK